MRVFTFYNIIFLFCNMIAVYTKYRAMYIFFDKSKTNKKIEIFLFVGYFIINSGLYFAFKNPNINLANNIILLFLLTFNYISSTIRRITAAAIIQVIALLIEIMTYHFLQLFEIEIAYMEIIVMLLSRIIFYFIVFLAKNLTHIKPYYKISIKHISIITSVSISTIYIVLVLINGSLKNNDFHIIFCIILLLGINIFISYIYDILNRTYEKELEKQLLEQQSEFYIKQLKITNDAQDNIKFIKHDLKNHLVTIKAIAYEGDKINDYINNILNLGNISNEYANSGNSVIDSILNYKLQEAKKKDIEIEIDLKIPYQLNIQPYDIGVILGNLLDNAIEAASKNQNDKKIKVIIYFEKNNLSISITNTFNGILIIEGKKYKTTNKNKLNHGFGLLSVEKALEKYDGEMDISYTDSLFSVKVLMYNNIG